jgi:hypothetical protein
MANLIKNQSFQKLIITFIRYSKAISFNDIIFNIFIFSINIQGLEKIPVYKWNMFSFVYTLFLLMQ